MTHRQPPANQVTDRTKESARQARRWTDQCGRFGFAAIGLVYLLVGGMAIQTALGQGGMPDGTQDLLLYTARAPFGQFLLGAIALGLIGYALSLGTQAVWDTENKGADFKGILARSAFAIRGIVYGGLGISALRLTLLARGVGISTPSWEEWAMLVLTRPFGQWLIALSGAAVIGAGLLQLYQALTARFRPEPVQMGMSQRQRRATTLIGRYGYTARGVVLGLVGVFLIAAAFQYRPETVHGVGEALVIFSRLPYGSWLVGVVAVGLIAYGIFMLLQARYHVCQPTYARAYHLPETQRSHRGQTRDRG